MGRNGRAEVANGFGHLVNNEKLRLAQITKLSPIRKIES
jgi:hypothetical protein